LQAQGANPNGILIARIFCSLFAAMCLFCGILLLIVARLICNLLDGLVAVESGM